MLWQDEVETHVQAWMPKLYSGTEKGWSARKVTAAAQDWAQIPPRSGICRVYELRLRFFTLVDDTIPSSWIIS